MGIKNIVLRNKRITICLVIALGIGVVVGASNMPEAEYNNLVIQKEQLDNEIVMLEKQLEESKIEINYLQVKKDDFDRLAKEEAEAKAEVEMLEKEEAERVANEEADRVAKEAVDRIAQEEVAQQQDNSQTATENVRMVWVANSNTEVYHSKSGCSNMSSPSEITYESAQARGLRACKKC